ncbi:MAG: 3-phosphoshikimate 1-carboxyvinyltransferase [Actinomycetota bacterium]|nr:3-phosphoshikimate 1-carboxyvinyltransferase [Actinomycetota bacterium]
MTPGAWVIAAPAVVVVPSGPVDLRLAAPASKSVTNRALVVAALANGTSRLRRPGRSDDARAMRGAVAALGAQVDDDGDDWIVTGTRGRPHSPRDPIDAALSGTTMRFATAVAALAPWPVTVTGAPGLLRRPIGPLSKALRSLGAQVVDSDGFPPVTVGGGLRGGAASVDASSSSQFASAVLLAAACATGDVELRIVGSTAQAYVDLTAELMRRWGADLRRSGDGSFRVRCGGYTARDEVVEYDASAAAHLFGLAAATGGTVTVTNAGAVRQPDAAVPGLLATMGATVTRDRDAVTVKGPAQLSPIDVDLGAMPDQVTTIAALAALAPGVSQLTGVAVVRGHETDRLAALATELVKLGVEVEERTDGLRVHGGRVRGPARLATYDDHRLAMAFTAIAARVPGITVENPGCVTKTYPNFWTDLAAGGVRLAPS